ncbi:MAG: twin-arginine translocase subunit TatC [Oscillospiraceae bacterium]|nr:twin-arginine translocase subunit TatC [Oscillospiraceae bacterium]
MKKSKTKSKKKANDDGSMSLSGHLKELRNRILVVVILLLVAFTACLSFSPRLITFLTDMGEKYNYVFVYIAPQELLLVYLNTALIGALVICFPVVAYEVYAFCSPGMKQRERTFFIASLLAGTMFFVLGVAFARFISLPFVLRFLIQFTGEVDVSASISIQQYVGFLMTIFVVFGLVFELPVVSVLLTGLGLIQADWLRKGRKIMIVIIFVLAAIITPPDVVSQVMVAVPMIGLYELSIGLSALVGKRRKAREDSDEDEDEDD